jgi:uracil-DNA glycosylase family 4
MGEYEKLNLDALNQEISACQRCPKLVENRTNVVPGSGHPDANIMFVGEAPGRDEDIQGIPFVGQAGKLLDNLLEHAGFSREEVFIANTLKCRPPDNRDPLQPELDNCREFLLAQIAIIKPAIIAPLGNFGLKTLITDRYTIGQVHGTPVKKSGILFFPLYHPAAALRNPKLRETLMNDFRKLYKLAKREGLMA